MRTRTPFAAVVAAAAVLAAAQPVWSQDAPSAGTTGFSESVEVNLVNVEVYVVDKNGNPVTDLTKDDFELFENGDPVTITNFFAVADGKALTPVATEPTPPPAEGEAAPPPTATRPKEPALPEDQRLSLLVYIDNYNIRPFSRNRVFQGLRHFLSENVTTDDRVALVSYERSFHFRIPFTTDPTVINRALADMEKESGWGVHRDSDRQDVFRAMDEAEDVSDALQWIRNFAGSQYNDLMFTINALKDFVSTLAGLPGRKALIYVSDGLPMIVAQDLYDYLQIKFKVTAGYTEMLDYDASRRFQILADEANSNRVSFYTIDAGGLRTYSSSSVESAYVGGLAHIDSMHFQNIQAPLQLLAEETGGRAIINANDVYEPMKRVARDLRNYYSLGFVPAHSGSGRRYEIDVKVKRPGVKVEHRRSYRDKTVSVRMNDGVSASLIYGADDNPMKLAIGFGQQLRGEDGNFTVPIRILIPVEHLTLLPADEGTKQGRIRLYIAAMDEKGRQANPDEMTVPVTLEADKAVPGHFWAYDLSLVMRQGEQRVAVGVRDDIAGVPSFVSRVIHVGA